MKQGQSEFEILSHPADLKIRAFGKTKKELFLNMLKAMTSILSTETGNLEERIRPLKVKSIDTASLLVDFLNEILYLTQVHREIYTDIKFKRLTDQEIKGEMIGQPIDKFQEDIKAATYHGLEVQEKPEGWEATVLFDV